MAIYKPISACLMLVALGSAPLAGAQSNAEVARRIIEKPSNAVLACKLLSNDEVVKLTGRPSYVEPEGVQLAGGGSSCTWDAGVNINLYSGRHAAQNMEGLMKSFKIEKAPRQTVAGIGDSATMTHMMLGKYQGNHALLTVRKGEHVMGISLEAKESETPQAVEPKLITVAKTALARLP
jgi:hypothetical protein